MLRSMFSGVSGLRSHQTMMDVVANNVANVNTAGFKSSRVTFQENLSQVMRGASGLQPVRAGTNPVQVGLGTQVGAVDGVFTQGAAQLTGRATDVAIQGEGFFVVKVGNETRYTRAGAMSLDRSGNLATPSGGILQGWLSDPSTGAVDFNAPIQNLKLPAGQVLPPVATSTVDVGGSLPAGAADGTIVRTTIDVYDELGNSHTLSVTFTKTATANEWTVEAAKADGTSLGTANLSFDDVTGAPTGVTELDLGSVTFDADAGAQPMKIDFSDPQVGLNQLGSIANVEARDQDGSGIGTLRGFTIGSDGAITGQFSNGDTEVLGYMALSAFTNPSGLSREGESLFATTGNSGLAQIARPGSESVGLLTAGTLEMSNVDLAQEFTNLIVAQRGFQANSRSITTSDEMLQELVNLKR